MTYYTLRRKHLQLSDQETLSILANAPFATLSSVDVDNKPYGIPLSLVLWDGVLYLHCTNTHGHKLDNFAQRPSVCVSAVGANNPGFDGKEFTTYYSSALAFGSIREVTEEEEYQQALRALCLKYVPDAASSIDEAIKRERRITAVWAIDIDFLSGKSNESQR